MNVVRPNNDFFRFKHPWGHLVFLRSLAMLERPRTAPEDAEQAASVASFVARYVTFDERLTSDVMNVMAQRLSEPRVVEALISAVRRCPTPEKVVPGIERLARQAHHERLLESFIVLVGAMQLVPAWQRAFSEPWFLDALQRALAELPRRAAAHFLFIMDRQERVPSYLLEVVEHHPSLLANPLIGAGQAWRIHQARPTVAGWRVLGSSRTTRTFAVTPAGFGSELDVAIETLKAAISQEGAGATRRVLVRWLSELGNELEVER